MIIEISTVFSEASLMSKLAVSSLTTLSRTFT